MARVALRVLQRLRCPEPQGMEMVQSLHEDFGVSRTAHRMVSREEGVPAPRCACLSALRVQGLGVCQEEAPDTG